MAKAHKLGRDPSVLGRPKPVRPWSTARKVKFTPMHVQRVKDRMHEATARTKAGKHFGEGV